MCYERDTGSTSPIQKLQEEMKASFELLQQQLMVIERQLDGVSSLVLRSFQATLTPQARESERKRSIELAASIAKAAEDKIQKELQARAARGIPDDGDAITEEDIRNAENESLLG